MIILDTSVISALILPSPIVEVAEWLNRQPRESVWTTSVTVYELAFGIELLAAGRKRQRLQQAMERLLGNLLDGRVLSFDVDSARLAGTIGAKQRGAGRHVDVRDVQIAGIVAARRATLATRNVKHFEGIGLSLVNPWTS